MRAARTQQRALTLCLAHRLPKPKAFLSALPALLRPNGVAVIVSPYSWLEEYTPQAEWLGGCVRGCEDVASAPQLAAIMARHSVAPRMCRRANTQPAC